MSKILKYIAYVIIAIIGFFFMKNKDEKVVDNTTNHRTIEDKNKDKGNSSAEELEIPDNMPLSYKGKSVQVTKHAQCRMDCRHINNKEIMEVLLQDNINHNKTQAATGNKCPSYAYEGQTTTGKKLRIVMADCDKNGKLVTVIDLKNDFNCTCD